MSTLENSASHQMALMVVGAGILPAGIGLYLPMLTWTLPWRMMCQQLHMQLFRLWPHHITLWIYWWDALYIKLLLRLFWMLQLGQNVVTDRNDHRILIGLILQSYPGHPWSSPIYQLWWTDTESFAFLSVFPLRKYNFT